MARDARLATRLVFAKLVLPNLPTNLPLGTSHIKGAYTLFSHRQSIFVTRFALYKAAHLTNVGSFSDISRPGMIVMCCAAIARHE